jgi:hypothetical protein
MDDKNAAHFSHGDNTIYGVPINFEKIKLA